MATPSVMLRVKFRSVLSYDDIMAIVGQRAEQFKALPGLIQKYYLYNDGTGEYAGMYLWESHQAMNGYLLSELRATIASAYQAIGIPDIEVFDIVDILRDDAR